MKKVLFASTALVLTAGVASAEITFGGSANFGIRYSDSAAGDTTIVKNEIDFDIIGTGETDGGIAFGASLDLDGTHSDSETGTTAVNDATGTPTGDTVTGTTVSDPEVWIEAGGLKLSVGDIGEAQDVGGISDVGFDGLGVDDVVDALRENGSDDVRVDYAFGDINVAASVDSSSDQWAVGVSGAMNQFSYALGYRDNGATDDWNVTVGYTAGAIAVNATYAEAGADDGMGIDFIYTQGDLTVTAAYAESGANEAYGIGASYDLGGGASVAGGVAEVNGYTQADLGMNFSF